MPTPTESIQAQIMTITPTQAAAWLSKMGVNRKPNLNAIKRYAADMKAGRWILNGESIQISSDGGAINGQHRLRACLLAGTPFRSVVVSGLKLTTQESMDDGVKRTFAQILQMRGYRNAAPLASGLGILWRIHQGRNKITNRTEKGTRRQLMAVLDDWPELPDLISALKGERLLSGVGKFAVVYAICRRIDEAAADAFFSRLKTGIGIQSSDDPVWVLRRWLSNNRAKQEKEKTYTQDWMFLAVVIKAWNATHKNKVIRQLRYTPADHGANFPRIQGWKSWNQIESEEFYV